MVTNYETLLSDVDFLGRFRWRLAVIDEAHRLKNYHSRTFQTLKLRYAITRCVLLTGTPIQNNLAELYALLALAVPAVFPIGAADSFVKQFKNAVDKDGKKTEGRPLRDADLSVSQLQALLTPILLRRTLADVGVDLPPLTETVVQCPMTAMQKHWYLSVLEGHVSQLVVASSGSRSSTLGLQNVVMQLRKVCNHPYLFPGAEPEPFEEGDHIFQNSGKAWVLDRLLLRLRSEGHKVLLFSQSTHMLDILQDYMSYRGWNYERLDGSVRSEERWTSVQRFQRSASVVSANSMAKDEEAFVFLLSTRAGGVGLNLTNADTVILYDSDWNPQADLQAIGRAHRIGQTKPVRVIRLMTVNSVEEVILRRALLKLQLTKKVMSGGALTGLADTADDDQEDTVQQADSASLLRMIQFGLSKLTSQDPIELSNKLVDAALASASDTADVIDVSASVSSSSVTEAAPTVSPAEPGGADATVSLVDIEAAASQLQESLYGYEGKEYKPTARADEDVAVLVRVLTFDKVIDKGFRWFTVAPSAGCDNCW
jgi:chromodomain-helicase-DNA-binding protein 1-like